MKKFIRKYHQDFLELLNAVAVTDHKKSALDFAEGINFACHIVGRHAKAGGKVFFIGNGGSAAIASHMAIDFWKNGRVASMAFSDSSLLTCISNDFGYERVFQKPVEFFANKKDSLFAISSSGESRNILKGVQAARLKGCNVITLSGFTGNNPLRRLGACNFYVPSNEYGFVEVVHQYICHCILDTIIQKDKKVLK